MIRAILVILAAILFACMDRVSSPGEFGNSIFKHLNIKFYSKADSTDARRIPFTDYPLNFWHLCKSAAIGCLLGLIFTSSYLLFIENFWVRNSTEYVILGTLFIQTFNLFYNHVLKSKT